MACERILGAYSGGAVPDFHRLPNYNACVLLKQFQTSTGSVDDARRRPLGSSQPARLAIAKMTICSHNMTMKSVRIAELKSRLSEYLDTVRQGETIAVLNRDIMVAQIVPVHDQTSLRIRKPAAGTPAPGRVPLPKALATNIDIVELLLEERQGQR